VARSPTEEGFCPLTGIEAGRLRRGARAFRQTSRQARMERFDAPLGRVFGWTGSESRMEARRSQPGSSDAVRLGKEASPTPVYAGAGGWLQTRPVAQASRVEKPR
jgi:hypothetical protein